VVDAVLEAVVARAVALAQVVEPSRGEVVVLQVLSAQLLASNGAQWPFGALEDEEVLQFQVCSWRLPWPKFHECLHRWCLDDIANVGVEELNHCDEALNNILKAIVQHRPRFVMDCSNENCPEAEVAAIHSQRNSPRHFAAIAETLLRLWLQVQLLTTPPSATSHAGELHVPRTSMDVWLHMLLLDLAPRVVRQSLRVLEKWPNPKRSILQYHDWKGRTLPR